MTKQQFIDQIIDEWTQTTRFTTHSENIEWLEKIVSTAYEAGTNQRCTKCNNPFEDHHWQYGQRGEMYHTGCLLKDNTKALAMAKAAYEAGQKDPIPMIGTLTSTL